MYTQEQINEGQKKINGQLCYVDRILVETIKLLRIAIGNSPVFKGTDLDNIDKSLKHAYDISGGVASVKPPGCEPSYTPDPNWSPNSSNNQ